MVSCRRCWLAEVWLWLVCVAFEAAIGLFVGWVGCGIDHAHLELQLVSVCLCTWLVCSLWMVMPSLVKMEMVPSSAVLPTLINDVGKSSKVSAWLSNQYLQHSTILIKKLSLCSHHGIITPFLSKYFIFTIDYTVWLTKIRSVLAHSEYAGFWQLFITLPMNRTSDTSSLRVSDGSAVGVKLGRGLFWSNHCGSLKNGRFHWFLNVQCSAYCTDDDKQSNISRSLFLCNR
jgi:hypothetical protein